MYIYGVHHWQILWSSYRELARVGFEPTTTEFRSDALTDWATRLWVQLVFRANFVQLPQFHRLFSVTYHFGSLPLSVATFILIEVFLGSHMSVAGWPDTYGIHHWQILWSGYRKLAWVGYVCIYVHIYIYMLLNELWKSSNVGNKLMRQIDFT